MRPQQLFMLVIILGCGIAAAVLTQRLLSKSDDSGNLVPVVIVSAEHGIKPGEAITDAMIKVEQRDPNQLPADVISKMEDVVEKYVRYSLGPNEIVTKKSIVAESGPARLLEGNQRLVTVSVNNPSSFIKPLSFVDVILNCRGSGENLAETQTLLQNIKVLAVDNTYGDSASKDPKGLNVKVVHLAVEPKEVLIIEHAKSIGTLELVLRGSKAQTITGNTRVNSDDIFGSKKPEAVAINPPIVVKIEPPKPDETGKRPAMIRLHLESDDLNPETVTPSAFNLWSVNAVGTINNDLNERISLVVYDEQRNVITINLSNSLPDGKYLLRVKDKIKNQDGAALDGDRDGTAGGSFEDFFTVNSNRMDAPVVERLELDRSHETAPPTGIKLYMNGIVLDPGTVTKNSFELVLLGDQGDKDQFLGRMIQKVDYDLGAGTIGISIAEWLDDGNFRFTVRESIQNADGVPLDGDSDGNPGDEYTSVFSVESKWVKLVTFEDREGNVTFQGIFPENHPIGKRMKLRDAMKQLQKKEEV